MKTAKLLSEIQHLKQICGDDPELVADMVEGETDVDYFVGRVVQMIGEDEMMIAGIGEYQKTIAERKKRLQNRAGRLRTLLAAVVTELPDRKFTHPVATVSVSDIDPKPIIDDESLIPTQFWKQADPKLDTTAIRKQLLARRDAMSKLAVATSDDERKVLTDIIDRETPAIPGASLDNGDFSVTISRR